MNSFENLIAPISATAPTGSYLKLDRTEYRAIRNQYNASLSSFRQLIETAEAFNDADLVETNRHNWSTFRDTVELALCQKTKDLELLSWYITTLVFSNNPLSELANGFNLLTTYLDNFWDSLHPTLPDNKLNSDSDEAQQKERAEFRIKPLLQFIGDAPDAGALFMPAQFVSLIGDINYSSYLHAEKTGSLEQLKTQAHAQLDDSVKDNIDALNTILAELSRLDSSLEAHCLKAQITPISVNYLKDIFQAQLHALRVLVGDKHNLWATETQTVTPTPSTAKPITENPGDTAPSESGFSAPNQSSPGHSEQALASDVQIHNREQAFKQLSELAAYFRTTEPHSPTSYLLERAIQWGHLSLPELMTVLMGHDQSALNHIDALIGVNDKPIELTALSTQSQAHNVTESISTATDVSPNHDAVGSASTNNKPEENPANKTSEISDFNW
ncbi:MULTISPECIES: ImpA family type VI secretion system protein [Vibrio]|uniref:type VI secretion system protein TssA n=1 Tax=Vibrio TaxID=662 RepID=UPI003D0E2E85